MSFKIIHDDPKRRTWQVVNDTGYNKWTVEDNLSYSRAKTLLSLLRKAALINNKLLSSFNLKIGDVL